MRVHQKKIWPQFYDQVTSGKKPFDLRKNDCQYQEGDVINMREWDPDTQDYTGRGVTVDITYVMAIADIESRLKSALGLNPCMGGVNELAILGIRVSEGGMRETP